MQKQKLPPPPPFIELQQQSNSNQECTSVTQQACLPPPPPPPLLILPPPPPVNNYSYQLQFKRRHLAMLNGTLQQFDCRENQVQNKLKGRFQKAELCATEGIADQKTQVKTVDQSKYQMCQRCQKKIPKSQFTMHKSFHAAIILDNLLLGDMTCAQSPKQLIERMKVTHVVNAATELSNYLEKHGLKYMKLELCDNLSEELIGEVRKAYQFIKSAHEQGGTVFVHCAVGKSRSVSVILIYLLLEKGIGIKQGLKMVKQKRPIASPNMNYMNQLLQFQKNNPHLLQNLINQVETKQ